MASSNIEFESLSPNLVVTDVNLSVKFYTEVLGFAMLASVPDSGKYNWAMVQKGNVTMMFQTLVSIQEDLPSLGLTMKGSLGTFYIKVKGFDELLKSVQGKAEIAVSMRTTFYGAREFAVKDPDGYFLMFAEDQ